MRATLLALLFTLPLLAACAAGPAGVAFGRSGTCSGTYEATYDPEGRIQKESCQGDLAWGGSISQQASSLFSGLTDAARGAAGAILGQPSGR